MWPLMGCSILLMAMLLERAWTVGFRYATLGTRMDAGTLTAHRRILPFFTDVPPALGLLGTVIGVVQSFRLLDDQINAEAIGSGLAVACTTTIFGISIAVIATVSTHVLDLVVSGNPDFGGPSSS